MSVALSVAIVLGLLASLPLCGSENDDSPSGLVEEFYRRVEKFDTVGLAQLVCTADRSEVESGLGLLQAFLGLGNLSGVPVGQLQLADFQAETTSNDGLTARVTVRGRLLAGPPLGSVELDDEIELHRENGSWCLAASPSETGSAGTGRATPKARTGSTPALSNTFTVKGGCASVDHPDGWSVFYTTDCSELLEKRDFYLSPSNPASCDEHSAHFDSGLPLFDLRLERIEDEDSVAFLGTDNDAGRVILTFHSYECSDVDEQLSRAPLCSPYRYCQQEYEVTDQGSAFDDTIGGHEARCLLRSFSRDDFTREGGVQGEWIQCFATVGTALVSVNAISWDAVTPTIRQILDTIAIRGVD